MLHNMGMLHNMAAQHAPAEETPATDALFHVVLKPLSHPQLDDIRIEEDLFAIGRTEPPFVAFGKEATAGMSRRHARIFNELGAVYVADLGSKNGTTVNGVRVHKKPGRLRSSDELCFGGDLCFRVELLNPPRRAPRAAHCLCLTLTPERDDLGLQPMVITSFPFLINKADDAIARYRAEFPHQVKYISRRHAHIFLKGGAPFVEDLGSTNGTYVDGTRLDEHAVALSEGSIVAFGGTHFVYRVGIQEAAESTLTRVAGADGEAAAPPPDVDKTTFIATADSFLDIFCVDIAPETDDAEDEGPTSEAADTGAPTRSRARLLVFLSQLREAFGSAAPGSGRWLRLAAAAAIVVALAGVWRYQQDAPQRELVQRMAQGDYAGAARLASALVVAQPDDATLQAQGTEALLRAHVPPWSEAITEGDFGRAAAALTDMQSLAADNPDARPLVDELAWIGDMARFVAVRGGLQAPIGIFAGEGPARALIDRWRADPRGHQRALSQVANLVPQFNPLYARTLSQLRRLESDASVYLGAIERLKSTLEARLQAGDMDGLAALLREYAGTYPRLTGLDALGADLVAYRQLEADTAAAGLGERLARFEATSFATPPFEAARARLRRERLPAGTELDSYRAAMDAWRAGDSAQAIATLETLAAGPWGEALAAELAHRKAVAAQFAALGTMPDTAPDRLLKFVARLDPEDDRHYLAALDSALTTQRTAALAYADTLMKQAASAWSQYRADGAISDTLRRELQVSAAFRARAEALGGARRDARRATRLFGAVNAPVPNALARMNEDIVAELDRQRRALQDLRGDLDADRLATKLTLIGGRRDEE